MARPAGEFPQWVVWPREAGSSESWCGPATSAVGPFYCPADREVYIDRGFQSGRSEDCDTFS